MNRLSRPVVVILACWAAQGMRTTASASAPPSIGGADVSLGQEFPGDVELYTHHDYSFEYGCCWEYGGNVPPYYGALAEAFNLGAGSILGAAYWLTTLGYFYGARTDVYVWEGGIGTSPGQVLAIVPDIDWYSLPIWPGVAQNDIQIAANVTGEFTIGYWSDFSSSFCYWFCAADLNGPGGYPWTCVAPGQPWPSGWQDARIVWGDLKSLGIGVYFHPSPTPVEPRTWGKVKSLFR